MRRKVGRAKRAAVRDKKTLSPLLEEALQAHLPRLEGSGAERRRGLVQETRGVFKVDRKLLKAVMAEEGF